MVMTEDSHELLASISTMQMSTVHQETQKIKQAKPRNPFFPKKKKKQKQKFFAMASSKVACIVLAAGFGTRLTSSIASDPSQCFLHLLETPKPLLPLTGSTIVHRWVEDFSRIASEPVVIVSNAAHFSLYQKTFAHSSHRVNIVNDGATNNENRLGALGDLELAIRSCGECDFYVVVAGDTLLHHADISLLLQRLVESAKRRLSAVETVGYAMKDPRVECSKRGVMLVSADGDVKLFKEKPKQVPGEKEGECVLAGAPLYVLSREGVRQLESLLKERREERAMIAAYDAPGHLLERCVASGNKVGCTQVEGRIDLGSLEDYIQALLELQGEGGKRGEGEVSVGRCWPRIGLLGNPSDGYKGACISSPVELENLTTAASGLEARAFVRRREDGVLEVLPNRLRDRLCYAGGWDDLCAKVNSEGYYGGIRLIYAALIKFREILRTKGIEPPAGGLTIGYDSSIPYSVGLAGSSAIIVACMRALLVYCGLSKASLGTDSQWSVWVLEAEQINLKIAAGLQDRVAQWFSRPMRMDFSGPSPSFWPLEGSVFQKLLQTPLYVVVSLDAEESGVVHASLRQLYDQHQYVRDHMTELAQLPKVLDQDFTRTTLCDAMDRNFELRKAMLGPGIGKVNVDMVELARANGMAAKQCGSGGAIVCVPRESGFSEPNMLAVFSAKGYTVYKAKIIH